ncbi:GNAT family N-acetyltransferase [Ornithinibacillus halotolerans]|uniref:N-acetyltransferase n=1 Tax=Ornithinibacillus halotolerans TaxID=1274357 RepID=A0A916RZQ1_9BACI|nr:GNAT family N-acetyltransferase [Ornithinibacillus halotolerans]GGA77977.1 N-acetyltransferase [Ornithinibacillus halotolerans]
MFIREAVPSDAEGLVELMQHVENTSPYMMWEKGERAIQPENLQKRIISLNQTHNSTILVAVDEEELVGYLFAIGGSARRNKHTAYLVVGVRENVRGKGIGTILFKELDSWAKNKNIHRLELTVVTKNSSGLNLYKKAGFEIEGTKKDSLFIDGEYVDEYYMGKIL